MYLKSLEMQGFKSFPDKTKLTFEGGATVIVGPNGSGKSNISDAMRWVLGEASSKQIRGAKMEDIIFGGADSRRPMGYAEVSVTFDNTGLLGKLDCPYDEVTVTRRYYRAGDSEYFINRRPCRLKDIYELFLNTGIGRDGYSIIGQGKIAEIVSRKSDERRSIFEDASGIAKYRVKKNETERKLSQTEDNMTRVADIFAEVEAQVIPLGKEAEKAKKALELMAVKKEADVRLWLYDTDKLRADLASADQEFGQADFERQRLAEAIASLEKQRENLHEKSQTQQTASEALLDEITSLGDRSGKLDGALGVLETKLTHNAERSLAAEEERTSALRSAENEQNAAAEREKKIASLEEKKRETEAAGEKLVAEREACSARFKELNDAVDTALGDIREAEKEQAELKARREALETAQSEGSDRHRSLYEGIEGYRAEAAGWAEKAASFEHSSEAYGAEIEKLTESKNATVETLNGLYDREEDLKESFAVETLAKDAAKTKADALRSMEENMDGYSEAVKTVIRRAEAHEILTRDGRETGKVYGPLSKLISVAEEYVVALETALGPNLQHIVVEDEEVAKDCMADLKKNEGGRATFFPLTSMHPQTETEEMRRVADCRGYVGVADTLAETADEFTTVLSSLLGRTLVFDTIDNANVAARKAQFRVKIVTLDGQIINAGGSFTGGSVRKGSQILSRRGEIRKLEETVKNCEENLAKKEKELREIEAQITKNETAQEDAESRIKLLGALQSAEKTRADQMRAKEATAKTLEETLLAEFDSITKAAERYEADRAELLAKEKETAEKIEAITAVRAEKAEERGVIDDRVTELGEKLVENALATQAIEKDIETEKSMIGLSDDHRETFLQTAREKAETVRSLAAERDELLAQKEENRRQKEEVVAELEKKSLAREQAEKIRSEFGRKYDEIVKTVQERLEEKGELDRKFDKLDAKRESIKQKQDELTDRLWNEYEMSRTDALACNYPSLTAEERPALAQEQTSLRNRLRAIGNVDLEAVDKYTEVKTRYDTMKAQIDDLTKAKEELLSVISGLEKEMKTVFTESFEKINENFNRVFGELFGGGRAEILLTDPENVLESGIEIKAAPPGKIIKDMVQLSGGEQSFIAIALVFAILQVNPAPFCIFDEIEAALDEVNVTRFSEYVKRYSSDTQFVLITHRRGTMEAANRLYGVTMPERGISKVLSLDIDKISKKEGDDWDVLFG